MSTNTPLNNLQFVLTVLPVSPLDGAFMHLREGGGRLIAGAAGFDKEEVTKTKLLSGYNNQHVVTVSRW